ncbi:hypothetical protein [Nocardia otitidiscaviarum]|uniref:hypothetical protein n=1 Tax=Nocardia otitidiscaviarum TaxID=1823 RepID=UPI0024584803|nr:hypothetical protein [Nocardia otitidiscaviarum]
MGWLLIIVGGSLLLFGAFGSMRQLWSALVAWQYKDPEGNEPSTAGYAVQRIVMLIMGGVLVFQGCSVNISETGNPLARDDSGRAAAKVAEDLGTTVSFIYTTHEIHHGTSEPTQQDVQKRIGAAIFGKVDAAVRRVVREDYPGLSLFAHPGSRHPDGSYRFTLESRNRRTHCLVVTAQSPARITAVGDRGSRTPSNGLRSSNYRIEAPISANVEDGGC